MAATNCEHEWVYLGGGRGFQAAKYGCNRCGTPLEVQWPDPSPEHAWGRQQREAERAAARRASDGR